MKTKVRKPCKIYDNDMSNSRCEIQVLLISQNFSRFYAVLTSSLNMFNTRHISDTAACDKYAIFSMDILKFPNTTGHILMYRILNYLRGGFYDDDKTDEKYLTLRKACMFYFHLFSHTKLHLLGIIKCVKNNKHLCKSILKASNSGTVSKWLRWRKLF